jgi:hypothetical protein
MKAFVFPPEAEEDVWSIWQYLAQPKHLLRHKVATLPRVYLWKGQRQDRPRS